MTAETMDLFPELPHPEPAPAVAEKLSAGQRLTIRQSNLILVGKHPLSNLLPGLRLHPDAIKTTDHDATKAGPTCGTCAHRLSGRRWAKCVRTEFTTSHSAASDCRAWWPACTEFAPSLSVPTDTPETTT